MQIPDTFIYPTDTVWGIGGSLYSESSYKNIARIKKTGEDKPLSLLFPNLDILEEYFEIGSLLKRGWLEQFFSLESSLLLPLSLKKKEIPSWIYQQSPFVSLRCLETKEIQEIFSIVKTPITTTSLNLTGAPPITSKADAKEFHQKYCPELSFLDSPFEALSGRPSTMIQIDEKREITFLREGKYARELREHCRLLTT